jgi:enoyl-[acyl-carrier protein] reductase/trans-2-enoyl-CoA reductase (NAD+)
MKVEGIHEGCIEQIQRLFKQRLYTGKEVQTDDKGRIRIDNWEMRDDIQDRIKTLWEKATTENLSEIGDLSGYKQDFLNLFGFGLNNVDYTADSNELTMIKSINS